MIATWFWAEYKSWVKRKRSVTLNLIVTSKEKAGSAASGITSSMAVASSHEEPFDHQRIVVLIENSSIILQ